MTSRPDVSYAELVARESPRRIQTYLASRESWNTVRDLSAMSMTVAHEYRRRFVIELLQNAYDAHPADVRDGFVHFRLDPADGPHGTLYVANGGRPFTASNFDALTNLARSNKPPGEGIGNKGIGFRSVLEVCDWPEVYSCSPTNQDATGFDGLCFRFAHDADIERLTESNDDYEHVRRDISRYFLPVPAEPADPELRRLRQLGAVTVIRLPLRDQISLRAAEERLRDLVNGPAPVVLFLERLSRVVVEFDGTENDESETHELTRVHEPVVLRTNSSIEVAEVSCGEHRYFVATRRLRRDDVIPAIEASVQANALNESWLRWSGDADVSIAVPISCSGEDGERGLLYTYLPMEAASPLPGHLNAPFFTKLDRTQAVIADVPLNAFLLDTAADLSLAAAELLTTTELPYRARCAVDLLTWGSELDRLRGAAARRATQLDELPLVPVLDRTGSLAWEPLNAAYDWRFHGEQLNLEHIASLDVPVVHPDVDAARRDRLGGLHRTLTERQMEPTYEELADWVERWARHLLACQADPPTWVTLYHELVEVFPRGSGKALRGRRVLLDEAGKLRHAGPPEARRTTVFMPPRSRPEDRDTEAVDVPARLQTAVTYLHSAVPLLERTGTALTRTAIAEWLDDCGLVERFDRQGLLSHVSRLAARPDIAASTKAEALQWTFELRAASREGLADLARLNLPVPTSSGWRAAREVTFSAGWPGTLGTELERLLSLTSSIPALEAAADSLLVPPAEWPLALGDLTDWVAFLRELGVKDGLWPVEVPTPQQQRSGNAWDPALLARQVELPEDVARGWIQDVRERWTSSIWHPYTAYYGRGSLWVLPGQDAIGSLGHEARSLYALLIVGSIERWPAKALTYTFRLPQNHRSGLNQQEWPTPVSTFLRQADWFPTQRPGRDNDLVFARPRNAWHFAATDDEVAPRFAPLPPREHRVALQRSTAATSRLRQHGLRIWDHSGFAEARLRTIAELINRGEVRDGDIALVRKACRMSWHELTTAGVAPTSDLPLVVGLGDRLAVSAEDGASVFVPDDGSELVTSLLQALHRPMLVIDGRDGPRVADLLSQGGRAVVTTASISAVVLADGLELTPSEDTGDELVAALAPWLPSLIAPVLQEYQRFGHTTEASVQRSLSRLRNVRLVRAGTIAVSIEDEQVPMESLRRQALHLHDQVAPLIVAFSEPAEPMSWRVLAQISADVCALIGRSESSSHLRATALALESERELSWKLPTAEQLAEALETSPARVQESWRAAAGQIDHLLPFVAVELAWHVDRLTATTFVASPPPDRGELADSLSVLLPTRELATDVLSRAERASSAAEHWLATGIPLGDYNSIRRHLRLEPVHFPERHRAALESYLATHRTRLVDRFRVACLGAFRTYSELDAYLRLRSFEGLDPDPRWLEEVAEPAVELVASHVSAWMDSEGVSEALPADPLPPLDVVRRHNDERLEQLVESARPVVTAWAVRHSAEVPGAWASPAEMRSTLHDKGLMDFERLDEASLLRWLVVQGIWPSDMPVSRDLDVLGLPAEALDEGAQLAERAKYERDRAKRILRVGKREFDATADGYRELAAAVVGDLDRDGTRWPLRFANLRRIAVRTQQPRTSGGGQPGGGRRDPVRLSDEQRAAIGLVGEVAAYRWLLDRYDNANEASWVSSYRQYVIGGNAGNDSLGYDFIVHTKNRPLKFEVKATPTDGTQFELGTSQISAARAARKDSYRILFVRYALDPRHRELHMLPNPFERESRDLFRQANQGLRLTFDFAD